MPKEEAIGALWETEKNGHIYMTGTINGVKVVVFKNKYKTADKHPDWRVFVQKPKEDKGEW